MTIEELNDDASQDQRQAYAVAQNDAFVKAINKAIRRGKEKVKPGTYVDTTPPINARRLRGTIPMSACGSPSAMCQEEGGAAGAWR